MIVFAFRREQDVHVLALTALATRLANEAESPLGDYFSAEQSAAAARLGYGPDRIEQIRREMAEEYRKDRGWSLVQSIFRG